MSNQCYTYCAVFHFILGGEGNTSQSTEGSSGPPPPPPSDSSGMCIVYIYSRLFPQRLYIYQTQKLCNYISTVLTIQRHVTLAHYYGKRWCQPSAWSTCDFVASFPGSPECKINTRINSISRSGAEEPGNEASDFACALVLFPDQWAWYLAWERECMCACVQN